MATRVEMLRFLRQTAILADEGVLTYATLESAKSDLVESGVFDRDQIESILIAG